MLEKLFVTILEISVTTGAVVLLLKLVSNLLNKSYAAKLKYWIWLALALRLIIPINFSFPNTSVVVNIPDTTVSEFVNTGSIQPKTPTIQTGDGVTMPETSGTVTVPQKAPITIVGAAMLIWITGGVLFLVYQVTGYLMFRKKALRWSKAPADTQITKMLHNLATNMGIKKEVTVLISESVPSPLMTGFIKSVMFLPREDYSETDLYFILRHELTHYKRHDLWYKLFLIFVNAVHWFNPLIYLLFREASADLELSCDDEVIKGLPYSNRKIYSETILASITRHKANKTALTTYYNGGIKAMKSRFMNILNAKRKRNGAIILITVILTVCVAGGLVACTVDNQNTDEAESATASVSDAEYIYENMGYTVRLPEEYRDKVTLLSSDEMDSNTIIAVYQTATLEIYPEAGFIFSIVRHTPAEFEDYFPLADEIGGFYHFAKDESYYYTAEGHTDVQFDMSVMEEYQKLEGYKEEILSWFIENNNLTEYDHQAAVYEQEYTYPGVHAIYYITLSNDAEFEVILSKPIRQDDSGIWCVERMHDGVSGYISLVMPETDLTAMEYYTQMQSEADAGQRPELLDAEEVALTYLEDVADFARHIVDSSIEYINE